MFRTNRWYISIEIWLKCCFAFRDVHVLVFQRLDAAAVAAYIYTFISAGDELFQTRWCQCSGCVASCLPGPCPGRAEQDPCGLRREGAPVSCEQPGGEEGVQLLHSDQTGCSAVQWAGCRGQGAGGSPSQPPGRTSGQHDNNAQGRQATLSLISSCQVLLVIYVSLFWSRIELVEALRCCQIN